MRFIFCLVFAYTLFLGAPSLAQTWEVYDMGGSLQSKASFHEIALLGESVPVGRNAEGLFLLSADLRPLVNLQGLEVSTYQKPWVLVKGPKGVGAFHEYGQLALPLEYEEITTYTNRLLARKGKDYWIFEKNTGKTKWLGRADEATLTHLGMVIFKNEENYYLPLSTTPDKPYELLLENPGNFLLAKEASGYGLINQEGKYVLDPVIDQLEHNQGDNYFGQDENQYLLIRGFEPKAQVRYNSYHKITKEGDLMLEYIHGKLRRILEGEGILLDAVGMESVQMVAKQAFQINFRENKMGLHGQNGWLVAPISDAEWIGLGSEGLFPARKNGKYGYLDASGKWIIPPTFLEVGTFSGQVSTYRSTSTWGTLGRDGAILGKDTWEEIKDFSGGIGIALSAGNYYLIFPTGEVARPEGFDKISKLKEGYYLVEKEAKFGLLSANGSTLLPLEYDRIKVEKKDFFIVTKNGLSGILRSGGEIFLPLQYAQIEMDWNEQRVFVKNAALPKAPLPATSSAEEKRKKGV